MRRLRKGEGEREGGREEEEEERGSRLSDSHAGQLEHEKRRGESVD